MPSRIFRRVRAHRVTRGFALLELAAWMVVFLPVLVTSIGLFAAAYERNILQIIPEALMRETPGGVMTWRSDKAGGSFEVDTIHLDRLVTQLTERAAQEAKTGVFTLRNVSAKGCYWVFDVSSQRGTPQGTVTSRCIERGLSGADLSLESSLRARIAAGIAEPIRAGDGSIVEYVSPAVVIGVAVGGDFVGLGALYPTERMQHASVWVPRRDVVL